MKYIPIGGDMNHNAFSIYLQKKNKINLDQLNGAVGFSLKNTIPPPIKTVVYQIQKNIEQLGFSFSAELVVKLSEFPESVLYKLYEYLIPALRQMKGAHVRYHPMYPNFPAQVKDASDIQLFVDAIIYAWSGFQLLPNQAEAPRYPALNGNYTILNVGSREDYLSIYKNILTSNVSPSEENKEILRYGIKNEPLTLPDEIPNKETAAIVNALFLELLGELPVSKTATDVLRAAVALSGGDVSLADKTRFGKISRPIRRVLLNALDKVPNLEEDLARHPGAWIRLAERLHPGEHKSEQVRKAFSLLRQGEAKTFNGKVEKALETDLESTLSLLEERPGDFARRLNEVVRKFSPHTEKVIDSFEKVADRAATPLLLQMSATFGAGKQKHRIFAPKGNVAKIRLEPDNRSPLLKRYEKRILSVIDEALVKKFSQLSTLGNVYIDPRLRDVFVPYGMRSTNKALKTIPRGSRLDLGTDEILRLFLWWNNGPNSYVDIDLSAIFLNDKFEYMSRINFGCLRNELGVHSGDIRNAPNGASEFIDINKAVAHQKGIRYVGMSVISFSNHPFSTLPECFAGYMGRKGLQSEEIFDPKTVLNKIDIVSETTQCLPCLFDLVENKMIWVDQTVTDSQWGSVYTKRKTIGQVLQAISELVKPNMYDLFELHAKARGKLVKNPEKADTVFSIENGTHFDLDTIASQYMGG